MSTREDKRLVRRVGTDGGWGGIPLVTIWAMWPPEWGPNPYAERIREYEAAKARLDAMPCRRSVVSLAKMWMGR